MIARITSERQGTHLTITVDGDFTFDAVRDFRSAYKNEEGVKRACVDLTKTKRIDSSALGMLIALWIHLGAEQAKVTLQIRNAYIIKVLGMVGFDKKFTIETE